MSPRVTRLYFGLASAGIAIAIYHAYDELTHYTGVLTNTCNLTAHLNCIGVYAYGYIGPMPLYLTGLVWFPLLIAMGLLCFRYGKPSIAVLFPFLFIGNVFTLYLWYQELAVIHVVCPVCASMYIVNYAITVVCGNLLLKE